MVLTILLAMLLSVSFADAVISNVLRGLRSGVSPPFPKLLIETGLNKTFPVHFFNQLIDHNNPGLGTFQQRYWMNDEFYKAGGPIILSTPGEVDASASTDYLTNKTINGMIAQQQHGATVVLEHRFFGYSNPYDNLTSQSLELLTIQQAIEDLVCFAQNVNLPMLGGDKVKPNATPWVLIGGGYSGALTSWTMYSKPGIFHAGYASSAVVEAMTNYHSFLTPILEYMPQNCSSDVQAVVAYLDQMYAKNNTSAMQNLKEVFGLGGLSHIEDFAAVLELNLMDWQYLQPDVGPGAMFFQFCDALEVKDGVSAPATGWGLQNAIHSWGSFWKNTYYPHLCGSLSADMCLGTYNASIPYWSNITINNHDRSLFWIVCNELGGYPASPPEGQPAIVSRIVQPIYWERQCVSMFPDKFSSAPSPSTAEVNTKYGGWNVSVDRLFFANGRRDPWRELTVSADGLNKANTSMQPIYESDAFYFSDLAFENGIVDETVHAVQMAALKYMKTWLA